MTKPHVLVTDWLIPDFDIERNAFETAGCTWSMPTWSPPAPPADELHQQLLERIRSSEQIDAVLFQLAPLNAEVIDALSGNCKIMQRVGIGLDNVDLEYAAQRGIEVRNVPDYCTQEVSVQAMAKLLSMHRQLSQTHQALLKGPWLDRPPHPITRLSDLTLGLIGLGRIGKQVAEWMGPMVGRILFYDPYLESVPSDCQSVSRDELLREADLISLHCPLTSETRKIIDEPALRLVKPTAILANTARGGLIDAAALADALSGGRLAAAALDVFDPEVPSADSPLRRVPNAFLTSHTAWYSEESKVEVRTKAVANILNKIAN